MGKGFGIWVNLWVGKIADGWEELGDEGTVIELFEDVGGVRDFLKFAEVFDEGI